MDWISLIMWLEAIGLLVAALAICVLVFILRDERQTARDADARATQSAQEATRQEAAHREEQARGDWYRLLFDRTSRMVLVHEVDEDGLPGQFLDANDSACSTLGYTREQLMQMTPMDLAVSDSPIASAGIGQADTADFSERHLQEQLQRVATQAIRRLMRRVIEDGHAVYPSTYQARNGAQIPLEISARSFQLGDRRVIMCSAEDVTPRLKARKEIEDIRRRFQDFFSVSPIGIAIYDSDRRLLDVNPASLRIFGIPGREEFAALDFFQGDFVPEPIRRRLLAGETIRFEAALDFDDIQKHARFVTTRSGPAHFDILVNSTGPAQYTVPRGYFVQVLDISESRRMAAAIQASQEQLRQAEKMEAIGAMAGGIAHDFNNILTPIIGYTKMMLRLVPESDNLHKFIQGINKASERAKSLVAQILAFSRKGEEQKDIDLHPSHLIPIVKEVLNLQKASLPPNVEIKRVIKAEHDVVRADPTKVHQILMNLCTNAGHALRETGGGTLEVTVMDLMIDPRGRSAYPDIAPGRYLELSVRDTGTGMDKATQARIFEPFFTTKKKGEGTGMGLAVVHGIVRTYKGAIAVESEPGKGSTFRVVLPLVEAATHGPDRETLPPPPTGSERLLLVDDEPDNLQMLAHMLQPLGYQVTTTGTPEDALIQIRQNPGAYHLVITDQVMPRMKGTELAAAILQLQPALPILMLTGHIEGLTPDQVKACGIRALLRKPIDPDRLAHAIRRELDAPAPAPA